MSDAPTPSVYATNAESVARRPQSCPEGAKRVKRTNPEALWNSFWFDEEGNIGIKAMWGNTPWASNLFEMPDGMAPLAVQYEDKTFTSSEAAYQYAKAVFFDRRLGDHYKDHDSSTPVLRAAFPSTIGGLEAKKMGGKGSFAKILAAFFGGNVARAKRVYDGILKPSGGIPYETTWFGHSKATMKVILASKYANPSMKQLLLATRHMKTVAPEAARLLGAVVQRAETPMLYERKSRGGTIWEKGKDGWGLLGEILMALREELPEERLSMSCVHGGSVCFGA